MSKLNKLEVFYPVLPPTANRIYVKGSILKPEAREYKEAFRNAMHTQYGHLIQELPSPKTNHNLIFQLTLVFYMDCLNSSWNDLKLPKTRRAENRFKKVDLTNRIKFFEDCIRDALDIDDSLTFAASQYKYHSKEVEGVKFIIEAANPENFGVPIVANPKP